ncbi:LPS export ABC transporter periplasmic protein LptC [Pseudaeromonas sp. ZJS20]|uniref:LPS export ABC transporter periplasmic protein LptC n=1 Tax=Pseudaeromonas aegiceratis TaxID=3153928 RepID=UPI00390C449D
MSRQTLLIGVLFLFSLLSWRWFEAGRDSGTLTNPEEYYQPTFTANKLKYLNFADNGLLRNEVSADYTEYYNQLEQTELFNPVIIAHDEQGKAQWRISAQQGILNLNDNAILRDQVRIQALTPNDTLNWLETPYLEMDLIRNEVRNHHPVTMEGPRFHLEGLGLRGQLNQRIYEILDKSHGIYFNQP